MEQCLIHHGVKGQQWGVLHGPPYPVNDKGETRIRKGSSIHRLSVRDENIEKGHAYVTFLKSDVNHYKGFFGLRLHAGPINWNKDVYDYEFTNTKDLISPSKKKRVDTFLKLYEKDPIFKEEIQKYYDDELSKNRKKRILENDYKKKYNIENASDEQKYDIFRRSLGSQNNYIRDEYFKKLKKEGYNFIIDDLDAGSFGKNPAIIFNKKNTLSIKGKKIVSKKESIKILMEEGASINKEDKNAEKKES